MFTVQGKKIVKSVQQRIQDLQKYLSKQFVQAFPSTEKKVNS
jgi:hypothetical protein